MKRQSNPGSLLLLCLSWLVFSGCSSDPASAFCQPGESQCGESVGVVLTCRADGSGWDADACLENTLCNLGHCQNTEGLPTNCTPGILRCQATAPVVERCQSSGTTWEEFLICPEGTLCLEGLCLAEPCSMGQTECGPATLYECNDRGKWEISPCPEEQPCVLGKCLECLKDEACSNGEICVEGTCQYLEPTIITSELPAGIVGTPYETGLEASGGSPPLTWNLSQGVLPSGIELTQDGILTGMPSTAETTEFTVTLEDDTGEKFARNFSLQIYAQGPVHITTTSIKAVKEGAPYSFQLAAAGGASPYAWQILAGSLPAGLTLSSTGQISGTPEEIGSFPLEIRVIDASSPPTYDAKDFALESQVSPLEIVGGQEVNLLITKVIILPLLIPIIPYSTHLEARGGLRPYTWTQGATPPGLSWIISEWGLPAGLNMNKLGRISGVVTDTSNATTVSIPGGLNLSGYFFMGKVTDAQSPSKSANAIFCIPTIAL